MGNYFAVREAAKKQGFFWDIFPKSVFPPTHPMVFVRFGKTKGEIWVKKGDFRGNLGGFEGFGPCLGISRPTHPHLGKISQKNGFFWQLPLLLFAIAELNLVIKAHFTKIQNRKYKKYKKYKHNVHTVFLLEN